MAKKFKGNFINSVRLNSYKELLLMIILTILFVLAAFITLKFKLYYITVILFLMFLYLEFKFYKKYQILKAGYLGESKAADILKGLSQSYTVMSDIKISSGGRTAQIDNLILTPGCIFVLEVKNYSGCLRGNIEDKELCQEKFIDKKKITKNLYNPFIQVKNHAYILENLLKKNGVDVLVDYGVLFVNENFKIKFDIKDENAFIYGSDCEKNLIKKLKSYGTHKKYHQNDIVKIIKNN